METFYVYVHCRATTGEPFYVGKGKGLRVRSKNRSVYWHRVVAKHGVTRQIVGQFDSEEEAFAAEVKMIAKLRAEGRNLVNFSDGGGGTCFSGQRLEDFKRRARARFIGTIWINNGSRNLRVKPEDRIPDGWVKGRINPDVAFAYAQPKNRPRQDGSNNFFYGKKHTEEWRAEHSAKMKGRPQNKDAVEKRAAARRGKPLSDDYKAALSAGKKGKMVFNNGVTFKFFTPGEPVPEGWVRGRPMTDEYKASLNSDKKGKFVFNNGVNQKFFSPGEPVPEGWVRGRVKKP